MIPISEELQIVPFGKCPKNKTNPFNKQPTRIAYKRERTGDEVTINPITKEHIGKVVYRYRKVDPEKFVKLYINNAFAWIGLSKKARAILVHIFHEMKPNTDIVALDLDGHTIREQTGYTAKASLYGGLQELIHAQIIAKAHYKDMFFINQGFVCNGKRATFVDTFEVDDTLKRNMGELAGHREGATNDLEEDWREVLQD